MVTQAARPRDKNSENEIFSLLCSPQPQGMPHSFEEIHKEQTKN